MSHPDLPQETLDSIVDFLDEETEALKQCCLVAKSWVPRARKHLFDFVEFYTENHIEAWKKTFPDPSNSPACCAHTLLVDCAENVTAADAAEGGWIPTFSRIVCLILDSEEGVAPFLRLSPTLKSISLTFTSLPISEVFTFICSFPFLEDLTLTGDHAYLEDDGSNGPQIFAPSTSPALTGSLELEVGPGIDDLARLFLDLPGGLRFKRLAVAWLEAEGFHYIQELVAACSGTLEDLDLASSGAVCYFFVTRWSFTLAFCSTDNSALGPTDLSRTTKLRCIRFHCESPGIEWVASTLETVTSEHQDFQQISVVINSVFLTDANPSMGWPDLDRVLVQFWESRSIRTKFLNKCREEAADSITRLLPESRTRGIIDLVEKPLWDL